MTPLERKRFKGVVEVIAGSFGFAEPHIFDQLKFYVYPYEEYIILPASHVALYFEKDNMNRTYFRKLLKKNGFLEDSEYPNTFTYPKHNYMIQVNKNDFEVVVHAEYVVARHHLNAQLLEKVMEIFNI